MKSGNSFITILNKFPKKRKELPEEYKIIYNKHYKSNREGETKVTSLSMKMEKWLHKIVASDVINSKENFKTLEIGAGTLNQILYEPNSKDYDIVEPFHYLYEGSRHLNQIKNIYKDINKINNNIKYSRITSVATFEHITNLPEVVARAVLLLESTGSLRVSVPNEGTIFWKLGTMITGFEFKRMYGLDYQVLMKYEHINTAKEIEIVLKYFFRNISTKSFGINKNLAFYRFFNCKEPDYEIAKRYLENCINK
ncbi:MAG: hypothetical protein WC868_03225 [Bacteroidales bacterium]